MKVDPVSEMEAAGPGLWPKGVVEFEIVDAAEQISKKGNDMIKLQIKIYDKEGRSRTLFDYLVSTEATAYKIRHCADACGLLAEYENGVVHAADLIGKTGKCHIGVDKGRDGYPPKNTVSDYVKAGESSALVESVDPALDDEIPF